MSEWWCTQSAERSHLSKSYWGTPYNPTRQSSPGTFPKGSANRLSFPLGMNVAQACRVHMICLFLGDISPWGKMCILQTQSQQTVLVDIHCMNIFENHLNICQCGKASTPHQMNASTPLEGMDLCTQSAQYFRQSTYQ